MDDQGDGTREIRNVTPDDWRGREARRGRRDTGTLVWGAILIAIGVWFFLDRTLGWDMPDVDWGAVWPVIIIVIGGALILQGLGRRRA